VAALSIQTHSVMTALHPSNQRSALVVRSPYASQSPKRHQGVVLIVALIILVIISLLAVTSMRGASSAESIAGNVRTTELAMQAAEIALRHCESSAIQLAKNTASSDPEYYATTLAIASISPINSTPWQSTATWDTATASSTVTYALPLSMLNESGMTATFKRPPECMVGLLSGGMPTGAASVTPSAFVITARGFGPEVAAAPTTRIRPVGSEVWLQSTIEIE
jgi:Tfp pilus assembly protein PilX